MGAELRVRDLQRLLSLPAWTKRHEAYGVWVATEIVRALHDHEIEINHLNGELKFAFVESRIADVISARPKVSLFSERRTPLEDPVGEGRVYSVQPDYGLWSGGSTPDECLMVIEVKHYKRRSRKNFRAVLIDYARAHPMAKVVLVNYGPVGKPFSDLSGVGDQCMMIGSLHPQNREARETLQNEVRSRVGEPLVEIPCDEILRSAQVFAIDVSQSMRTIIDSEWFSKFLSDLEASSSLIVLVDVEIRATLNAKIFSDWRSENDLDQSTALHGPVLDILNQYGSVVVVTDQDGLYTLSRLDAKIGICKFGVDSAVTLLQVSKPGGTTIP